METQEFVRLKFSDPKLAVIVCSHVFKREREILFVSHEGSDWQFMCGQMDHGPRDGYVVGVGHLIALDPSLNELADLPVDGEADRATLKSAWIRTASKPDA